jgi:hypothetical protein
VPAGLRTTGTYVGAPSISYVARRYLLVGANATQTATWVWSTLDGVTWHHVSSMARAKPWSLDTIVKVVRLDPGWLAIGQRVDPRVNDDEELVVWRSSDLVHWSRLLPATGATCGASVRPVAQAAVAGGRLVAVGNVWGFASPSCGETWIGTVTP